MSALVPGNVTMAQMTVDQRRLSVARYEHDMCRNRHMLVCLDLYVIIMAGHDANDL